MALAIVVEIFVRGLEHANIVVVLLRRPDVLTEQHAILIFDEPVVSKAWLPAEFRQHRADLGIHVRHLVHQVAEFAEVTAQPAQVRVDKSGLRMRGEQVMLLPH